MRLAALLESKRAKKVAGIIIRHRKILGIIFYVAGLVYLSQLPRDELNHRSFIDENALMTGLVKREFSSPQTITNYVNELETIYDHSEEIMEWVEDVFVRIGLEVYHHNYSAIRPAVFGHQSVEVSGRNVYGILRAGRSSSAECLVLSAPYISSSPHLAGSDNVISNRYGLAVMLSLAQYFKSKNYWAKDIIFLVTTGDEIGAQAWINSYMGDRATGIVAGPLPGRSGSIQAVINLELNSPKLEYAGVVIEGVNGILPNLDLVHVVTHLTEMEGIPSALHVQWEAVRPRGRFTTGNTPFNTNKLATVASLLAHQAHGLPLANHALFLRYRIDSVTVRGMGSGRNAKSLNSLARALEGSFRSLNNLLERLHHSEFFYYAPSRGRFISIGQFMPTLGLLLAPIILEALANWLLARGFSHSNSGNTVIQSSEFPFHSVLGLILPSFLSGVLLLCLPSMVAMLQSPLVASTLTASLLWGSCLSVFIPLFASSNVTTTSWYMAKCFSLILQLLLLLAMAMMNYALAICLILFLPLPAIFSQPHNSHGGRLVHRLGQLFLLLFSPPLSLLYLCCIYHISLTHDVMDITAVIEGGVGVAGRGLVLAYNSWYFVGSWLFPVSCLAVWPVWVMGWRLACQKVCDKEVRAEIAETDNSSSHPHSD